MSSLRKLHNSRSHPFCEYSLKRTAVMRENYTGVSCSGVCATLYVVNFDARICKRYKVTELFVAGMKFILCHDHMTSFLCKK